MMYQARSRQIARLEKRFTPHIEEAEAKAIRTFRIRQGLVTHATILAFLVRYGHPRIGEPLSDAFRRFETSREWRAHCDELVSKGEKYRKKESEEWGVKIETTGERPCEPYDRGSVYFLGIPLRHLLISTFRGSNEKDKLNRVFRAAPPWLIWFTFADYTAELLGLDLPDLSDVRRFERRKETFHSWWGFPQNAFECRLWPHGAQGEPLADTNLSLLKLQKREDVRITNRERKRARRHDSGLNSRVEIGWPETIPTEWLLLDFETEKALLAKSADPLFREELMHPEFF